MSQAKIPPAADFSLKRFGGTVRMEVSTVAVGTTPTRIVPNNPARVFLLAMNRSSSNGAADFTQAVSFASGFFISASGGSMSLSVEEDGEVTGWEVWGVQQSAVGDWRVYEVIRL